MQSKPESYRNTIEILSIGCWLHKRTQNKWCCSLRIASSRNTTSSWFSVENEDWGGRWDLNPPRSLRKRLNLLTDYPQFGRIWAQNFGSGRSNSPTLSTASRCALPITCP